MTYIYVIYTKIGGIESYHALGNFNGVHSVVLLPVYIYNLQTQ